MGTSKMEVEPMRVYLCGPMDNSTEDELGGWRKEAESVLDGMGITTLNPIDRPYRSKDYGSNPEKVLPDLVEADKIDIEMSDVVLANVTKPSVGTSMEILLAWMKDKQVIVVAPPGVQLSAWIHYHSHKIFRDMNSAYDHIAKFNKRLNG